MAKLAPLVVIFCFTGALSHNPYPKGYVKSFIDSPMVGPKLIFTKYIKRNETAKARELSAVTGLSPSIRSYAGFFTVNESCDSNLFFWFFPSQNNPKKDPLSIWLQGGPGSTSFYAALAEIGPYSLGLDGSLGLSKYPWTRNSSLIFIDNPVGTGYSYTGRPACYARDQVQVGRDVLNGLEQFFVVFPEYKANDFYVTGESFGGHYVPGVGLAIHNSNSGINLKGIAIGNGVVDFENQLLYSALLYQLGLVDAKTRDEIAATEESTRDAIRKGDYTKATTQWNELLENQISPATGFSEFYNFLYPAGEPAPDIDRWVTGSKVRKALHIGSATWHGTSSDTAYTYLFDDITRSYRSYLETLLDNYKVLIYNGQLDIIVGYALTEGYLQKLQWSHTEEYQKATRQIWKVGDDIAGYKKSAGKFTEVLVRNAGHMVPTDQPLWSLDLYNNFISNKL